MKYTKIASLALASVLAFSVAGTVFASSMTTGSTNGSMSMTKTSSSAAKAKHAAWLSCVRSAAGTEGAALKAAKTMTDKVARKQAISDAKATYKQARAACDAQGK